MLPSKEMKQLAASIKENGLLVPIALFDGMILDGRNRLVACGMAEVKPHFEKVNPPSPTAYVVACNKDRRHLSPTQLACAAGRAIPLLKKEAKERQKSHGETAPGKKKNTPVENDQSVTGGAREIAAGEFGVASGYITEVLAIQEKSPELFEQMESGEITLSQAKRKIKEAELAQQIATLPTDKFRVFYADPPWNYGDKCDIGEWTENSAIQTGGAEKHYPSQTIKQLCEMPVKEIALDDAVLFLWVTSPLLDECWPIIKAWGFEYKTSFVWDKVKHNMGHYNSVRHEFLLVCTRGSCTPDVKKLHDSVVTVERTKHSAKPEKFREIIDEIYPHGKRLELFARSKAKGWEVYGNEC